MSNRFRKESKSVSTLSASLNKLHRVCTTEDLFENLVGGSLLTLNLRNEESNIATISASIS